MSEKIYDWFYRLASRPEQENRFFIHSPSTNLSLTYKDFFKIIESSDKIDLGPGIENLVFDSSVKSLIKFFSLLRSGRDVAILHPWRRLFSSDSAVLEPDQMIHVLSSGNSGSPSLWPQSLHSLTWNLENYCQQVGVTSKSCMWSAFPPSSVSGLKALFIATFTGGSLLWEPYPTDIEIFNFPNQLASYRMVNALAFPPNFAEALLHIFSKAPFSFPDRIQRMLCGGDILLPETFGKFEKAFSRRIGILYGLTETAGPIFYLSPEDWEPYGLGKILKGSYQVSPENQRLTLSGGFLSPRIQQDWFETLDEVKVKGDRVFFSSRINEWILVRGEKVSLLEIENLIKTWSGVSDCVVSLSSGQLSAKVHADKDFQIPPWSYDFQKPNFVIVGEPLIKLGLKKVRKS